VRFGVVRLSIFAARRMLRLKKTKQEELQGKGHVGPLKLFLWCEDAMASAATPAVQEKTFLERRLWRCVDVTLARTMSSEVSIIPASVSDI